MPPPGGLTSRADGGDYAAVESSLGTPQAGSPSAADVPAPGGRQSVRYAMWTTSFCNRRVVADLAVASGIAENIRNAGWHSNQPWPSRPCRRALQVVAHAVLSRDAPPNVISLEPGARRILVASLLATLSFSAPVALASQPPPEPPPHVAPAPPDPEATPDPAPVLLGGESIIWITAPAGPYTTQFRAGRISERLREIVRDRRHREPLGHGDGNGRLLGVARGTAAADGRDAAGRQKPGRGAGGPRPVLRTRARDGDPDRAVALCTRDAPAFGHLRTGRHAAAGRRGVADPAAHARDPPCDRARLRTARGRPPRAARGDPPG